jgi:hypothetical protein
MDATVKEAARKRSNGISRLLPNSLWLLIALLLTGIALSLRLQQVQIAQRSPDEYNYMYYAEQTVNSPFEAPRSLVQEYNRDPQKWIYPPPLRIGYYYTLAAIMGLFHVKAEAAGVELSGVCSSLELIFMVLLGMRYLSRWTVLIAAALLSVCPPDLFMAHRVWQDGVTGSAGMIFLWLCVKVAESRKAGWWLAALWSYSLYFLLIKETSAIFYSACLLGVMICAVRREDQGWRRAGIIAAGGAVTALCSFVILALLCGGVPAVLAVVRHNSEALSGNVYATLYQNGPWYSLPLAFWVTSPLTTAGSFAGLLILCLPGRYRARYFQLTARQTSVMRALGVLIVFIIAAATVPPSFKNLRYVSFILGPWHLMSAFGISSMLTVLARSTGRRMALALPWIAFAVIALSCRADYLRYKEVFFNGIPDLNVRQLIDSPFAPRSP